MCYFKYLQSFRVWPCSLSLPLSLAHGGLFPGAFSDLGMRGGWTHAQLELHLWLCFQGFPLTRACFCQKPSGTTDTGPRTLHFRSGLLGASPGCTFRLQPAQVGAVETNCLGSQYKVGTYQQSLCSTQAPFSLLATKNVTVYLAGGGGLNCDFLPCLVPELPFLSPNSRPKG